MDNRRTSKYIIACAGAGKTTYLVNEAIKRSKTEHVLITTYTNKNEKSIIEKFFQINGCIPKNVKIKTWYSFLITNGINPYKNDVSKEFYGKAINGVTFSSSISNIIKTNGKIYSTSSRREPTKYYIDKHWNVYSDKIAEFAYECNEKSHGAVIDRITSIYGSIFIDEVQDFAGFDFEIIKLLSKTKVSLLIVGDPRQSTYKTSETRKNKKYSNGNLKEYIIDNKIDGTIEIDETLLVKSWRCCKNICNLVSEIFKEYENIVSAEKNIEDYYIIQNTDIDHILETTEIMQLRYNVAEKQVRSCYPAINFGDSKGLEFNNTIVYLTSEMSRWIKNHNVELKEGTKSKLYVALTRASGKTFIVLK